MKIAGDFPRIPDSDLDPPDEYDDELTDVVDSAAIRMENENIEKWKEEMYGK
jgi:hypothetical protein